MNQELAIIQKQIGDLCKEFDIESPAIYRLLDLNSELGELAKEILLQTNYGKKDFNLDDKSKNLTLEMGDVMFSLICLANSLSIDLHTSLTSALAKYQNRIKLKDNLGSN